jgi:hypothetical protein
MKRITLTLITIQTFVTPARMRLFILAAALLLGRGVPGLDDFNHGGVGGG